MQTNYVKSENKDIKNDDSEDEQIVQVYYVKKIYIENSNHLQKLLFC